jgi:hypothetical protein
MSLCRPPLTARQAAPLLRQRAHPRPRNNPLGQAHPRWRLAHHRLPRGAPAHRFASLGARHPPDGPLPGADPERAGARMAVPVPGARRERRRLVRPQRRLRAAHRHFAEVRHHRPQVHRRAEGRDGARERQGRVPRALPRPARPQGVLVQGRLRDLQQQEDADLDGERQEHLDHPPERAV